MQFPGGDASRPERADEGRDRNPEPAGDRGRARSGKGQLMLFATNPCYRWQNLGEFNMLFNTILHWNDLGR